MSRNFKKKILVGRNVRVACPWTDVITRNASAAYIHVIDRILDLLNIGENVCIAGIARGILNPAIYFRSDLGVTQETAKNQEKGE